MRKNNISTSIFKNKVFSYRFISFLLLFVFINYNKVKISVFLYKFNPLFKKFNYISKQEREKINIMENSLEEDKFKILNDSDFEISAIYFTGRNPYAILNSKKTFFEFKNLLIVNEKNVLVGIIYNLLEKNSKMYFLYSSDVNLPIFTSESFNYTLMTSDPFDTNCRLKIKYNEFPLKENEIVTTSGENGLIESGVLIGKIYFRNKDACIQPYHNLKLTNKLYVYKKQ